MTDPRVLVAALETQADSRRVPARLAGFSFGGLVATWLAALRGKVTHLALLGSAGHGTTRRPRGKLLDWKAAATSGDAAALETIMRHNLGVHMLHAQGDAIDTLALHVHTVSCLHTRFWSRHLSLGAQIGPTLEALPARLWLAWGAHDVTSDPPAVMRTLAAGHPARSARIIDGAGHWLQYEHAETVIAVAASRSASGAMPPVVWNGDATSAVCSTISVSSGCMAPGTKPR